MNRFDKVSKEQNKKLPRAGRVRISWHGWWFGRTLFALKAAWRNRTLRYLWSSFYMRTRGANFGQVWIGPVSVIWPLRWLEGPARALHPKAFE